MPRPWSARIRCAFVAVRRVAVRDAGLGRDPVHDPLVAVRLVDGADVLQDRSAALEAEPGVDVLLRKRRQRAVRVLLVLHEDEVPELEEPVTARAGGRAVGLAAPVLLAPVPVELGVRAARTWPADRPEVLGRRERDDPLDRHAGLLPEVDRHLVGAELQVRVAGVDRHPHAVPVELHVLEDELASERDRALLEVLAEREVAEHLEERQVVAVEPDLVDVDRPEDLLRGGRQRCGRRLEPEEVRHLRLHSGGRRGASSRRLRAGRASTTGSAGGPAPRRTRGSPHAARRSCASRNSTSGVGSDPSGYAAGGGLSRLRVGRAAELLVELVLAPCRGVLRDANRLARVAPAAERGDTVRHAGCEPAHLLDRSRDHGRDRPHCGVRAVGHRDGAVRDGVELVELIVDAVDRASRLHDHRKEIALGALDEGREPRERSAHADEQVEEPSSAGDEERRERVVEDVSGRCREHRHGGQC